MKGLAFVPFPVTSSASAAVSSHLHQQVGQLNEFVIFMMAQQKYGVTFSYDCPTCASIPLSHMDYSVLYICDVSPPTPYLLKPCLGP